MGWMADDLIGRVQADPDQIAAFVVEATSSSLSPPVMTMTVRSSSQGSQHGSPNQ
jgi:hypothetical protein